MSSGYTEAQLKEKIIKSAKDMSSFYKQGFLNYRGHTRDTDTYYTEVVAQWLCQNIMQLKKIPQITRTMPYKTPTHTGIPSNPDSGRTEELIAMEIFCQKTLPPLGEIIDYQTPLKNQRSDRAGKIDLLSYDGSVLRILELKEPDSNESMLRCVLEGYTYLRTADNAKLLSNFCLPANTPVVACPLVFFGGMQYQEMQEKRPWLKQLMRDLNSKPYYIAKNGENYFVLED